MHVAFLGHLRIWYSNTSYNSFCSVFTNLMQLWHGLEWCTFLSLFFAAWLSFCNMQYMCKTLIHLEPGQHLYQLCSSCFKHAPESMPMKFSKRLAINLLEDLWKIPTTVSFRGSLFLSSHPLMLYGTWKHTCIHWNSHEMWCSLVDTDPRFYWSKIKPLSYHHCAFKQGT